MSMDLYTDCPECESRGYDTDTRICKRCIGTTFIPVRVKALEWADSPIGSSVAPTVARVRYYIMKPYNAPHTYTAMYGSHEVGRQFPSLSAAKAACQDHHERMVMDMLEVVP